MKECLAGPSMLKFDQGYVKVFHQVLLKRCSINSMLEHCSKRELTQQNIIYNPAARVDTWIKHKGVPEDLGRRGKVVGYGCTDVFSIFIWVKVSRGVKRINSIKSYEEVSGALWSIKSIMGYQEYKKYQEYQGVSSDIKICKMNFYIQMYQDS